MKKNKLKLLALSALSIATLATNSAQAVNINVAVAANFTNTMNSLIGAFKLKYPTSGYTVTFSSDSSAVLQNRIISHSVAYDLFLSADQARPQQLLTNNPTLVTGPIFLYAVGELELWSPTNNISAGLPAPLITNIAIADPSKAPYGAAAAQVLASAPWRITPPFSAANHVILRPNIGLTYTDIKNRVYAYGFIHQSAICKLVNGVKTFTSGFHHTYPWNDTAHPHSKILQYGIKVVNSARTAAQNTELTNFVNFLATPTAQNIVKSSCYALS